MEYKLGKSLFSHAKIVQTKSYPVLTLNSSMMQKVEMTAAEKEGLTIMSKK